MTGAQSGARLAGWRKAIADRLATTYKAIVRSTGSPPSSAGQSLSSERLSAVVGAWIFAANRWVALQQFGARQRADLYRYLADEIDRGATHAEAIDGFVASAAGRVVIDPRLPPVYRNPSAPERYLFDGWATELRHGRRLAELIAALDPRSDALVIEAAMIRGIAESVEVSAMLRALANLIERRQQRAAGLLVGLAYPTAMMAMLCVAIWAMSVYLVPKLMLAFRGQPAPSALLRFMVDLSELSKLVSAPGLLALTLAPPVLTVLALWWLMPRWTGPGRTVADRYWPFSFYRLHVGASWAYALAALLPRSRNLIDALTQLGQTFAAQPYVVAANAAILRQVVVGRSLGTALRDSGADFPDLALIITVMRLERGANLQSSGPGGLTAAIDLWQTRATARLQAATRLVAVLSTLLLYGSMFMFSISYYQSMQSITASLRPSTPLYQPPATEQVNKR